GRPRSVAQGRAARRARHAAGDGAHPDREHERSLTERQEGRPAMSTPLATHDYTAGGLDAALEFLKRTRSELRTLRKVRVWKDKLHIIDVNKDFFEVRGLGYG